MVALRLDARAPDDTLAQIKTTQARTVGMRTRPDHLLVVQLDDGGAITELYNGPGRLAWMAAGKRQANGQRAVGVAKLRSLMSEVPHQARLRTISRN